MPLYCVATLVTMGVCMPHAVLLLRLADLATLPGCAPLRCAAMCGMYMCAGGISPTIVTALVAATGQTYMAPGVMLLVAAVVSMGAALVLLRYAPASNRTIVAEK